MLDRFVSKYWLIASGVKVRKRLELSRVSLRRGTRNMWYAARMLAGMMQFRLLQRYGS